MSVSRRGFLAGAGAAALFPWLGARAADAPIRRLVLFYTPHGTVYDQWKPSGSETDFTFSPILKPLERHRAKLAILDGLTLASPYDHRVPHTYDLPALWTGSPIDTTTPIYERSDHGVTFGWNTGISIDQMLASRLAPPTRFRTVELGVVCGGAHPATRMIYTGPAAPRNPLDGASRAFDQLFAGVSPEAVARRTSVLDAASADLARVSADMSGRNRERLDAHATSLRELEASLADGLGGCDVPERPVDGGLDVAIDQQSALLATALGCDLTRIASLQVRIADNDGSLYPWAGVDASGHHAISHETTAVAQSALTALYTWYAERFAALLDRLDAMPEGDGTSVLDHSLVVWGTEIGRGWDHQIDNVPFVVAGGGAGRVRGGRYLDVAGNLHNRLLVSIAQAMGLDDVVRYGDADTGTGTVPGLLSRA